MVTFAARWLGPTPRDRRVALTLLAFAAVGWPVWVALTVYDWVVPVRPPQ